jgi:hypothetical protein
MERDFFPKSHANFHRNLGALVEGTGAPTARAAAVAVALAYLRGGKSARRTGGGK